MKKNIFLLLFISLLCIICLYNQETIAASSSSSSASSAAATGGGAITRRFTEPLESPFDFPDDSALASTTEEEFSHAGSKRARAEEREEEENYYYPASSAAAAAIEGEAPLNEEDLFSAPASRFYSWTASVPSGHATSDDRDVSRFMRASSQASQSSFAPDAKRARAEVSSNEFNIPEEEEKGELEDDLLESELTDYSSFYKDTASVAVAPLTRDSTQSSSQSALLSSQIKSLFQKKRLRREYKQLILDHIYKTEQFQNLPYEEKQKYIDYVHRARGELIDLPTLWMQTKKNTKLEGYVMRKNNVLFLCMCIFHTVQAALILTPLEQELLSTKLTAIIEREHKHGHIPGDFPQAPISVKIGFDEQEKYVECICNVYLADQETTHFLIQGICKVPYSKIHSLKVHDGKIGNIDWKINTTAMLRKTRIRFLRQFERKMIKNIETIMRNDIESGKTTFTPTEKFKITVTPEYVPKDIASLYNPEEPVVRAIPNTYSIEIFNQDGSSAGLARMTMEEKEIRDFLERAGVKIVHSR